MVTTPPKIESTEDVLDSIPSNDINYYNFDEEEIRNGSVCECGHDRFGRSEDKSFYTHDKTAIKVCSDCGGFYGIVLNNWV